MSEKIVQTAGRDQLGEFAPMFAHLNDDVLFGEVWNEEAIDVKPNALLQWFHLWHQASQTHRFHITFRMRRLTESQRKRLQPS